ncbi:MAG: carbohydrate kinase [Bacteroidales bacterium]|nr:carbohydrate kinase [Bacteroidales bacterium]
MDKKFIIGIGEALWDMLPEGKKLGGAPANFAYHASQFGLEGMAVSAIGQDQLGEEIVEALEEHHLPYHLDRVEYPTGTVQVSLDSRGVPQYEIKTGVAWDNIPYTKELAGLARQCRAVCFGSLAQRSPVSRESIGLFLDAVPEDCLKVFDTNLRQDFYGKDVLEASFRRCDILKINDEELVVVARMFNLPGLALEEKCRYLIKEYKLKMLILTCGVNGSYVFYEGGMSFLDTPKVQVADTVGAGDSFTGAFVGSLLTGKPVTQAHETAVKVSAFVCTQSGAMPIVPDNLK